MANISDNTSLNLEYTHFIIPANCYDLAHDKRLLIPYESRGKIGFVNNRGEIVVEPTFDRIIGDIFTAEDYVHVGITYSYAFERKNSAPDIYTRTKLGLLNSDGESVLETKYSSIRVEKNGFVVGKAYGYDYDGTKSLLSAKGITIIPFGIYTNIDPFVEGLARCRQYHDDNGQRKEYYGIINESGEVILECKERMVVPFYDNYYQKNFPKVKELIKKENAQAYAEHFNEVSSVGELIHSLAEMEKLQEDRDKELSVIAAGLNQIENLNLSYDVYIDALANNKINRERVFGNIKIIELKNGKCCVINSGEIVVPFGKYAWIDGFDSGYARVRTAGRTTYTKNIVAMGDLETDTWIEGQENINNAVKREFVEHPENFAKWGIIDENGNEVLPVEFDEVWNFYNKGRNSTKVVKNGIAEEFYLKSCNKHINTRKRLDSDHYGGSYGEYSGSYAQDVMGYDDETINDAFDGDPDAYWNID